MRIPWARSVRRARSAAARDGKRHVVLGPERVTSMSPHSSIWPRELTAEVRTRCNISMVSNGPARGMLSIEIVMGSGADLVRFAGRSVELWPDPPPSPALDHECQSAESSARQADICQEELVEECQEEPDQSEDVVSDDQEVVVTLEELAGAAPKES